jgi:hypothetical protein
MITQEPDIRDETTPLSSREDLWDDQDRRHPPSQFPANDSQHASQFNGDYRHTPPMGRWLDSRWLDLVDHTIALYRIPQQEGWAPQLF